MEQRMETEEVRNIVVNVSCEMEDGLSIISTASFPILS